MTKTAAEARTYAASLPFATAEECDAKADAWLVVEDALREGGEDPDTRYIHQLADYWRRQAEMKRSDR